DRAGLPQHDHLHLRRWRQRGAARHRRHGRPRHAARTEVAGVLVVSDADFLWFVDQALDAMVRIVRELGDDANRRPELPGANSPYAILYHSLGVMEYWGGAMVAGRTIERD